MQLLSDAVELSGLKTDIPNPVLDIHCLSIEDISTINLNYLNHEGPTDVISFSYEDDFLPGMTDYTLGEIFICPEIAEKSALELGCTVSEELIYYIVHGILHLAGYDDHNKNDIIEMRNAEKHLLDELSKSYNLTEQCEIKESS